MDRRRFLPSYHYEDNTDGVLLNSVGKPLRDYKIYGAAGGVGSSGKNKFDKNNASYIIGYFNRNSTTISAHANARTLYISCKPNTTYTVSRNTNYTNFHFGYTEDLPAAGVAVFGGVTADNTNVKSLTTTTGAGAKYLVIYVYNGYSEEKNEGGWESIINGLQIEEGASVTDYEEYKSILPLNVDGEIYEIPIASQLGENDYIDYMNKQIVIDGVATAADLPQIPTQKGTTNIHVDTDTAPSAVQYQYYSK